VKEKTNQRNTNLKEKWSERSLKGETSLAGEDLKFKKIRNMKFVNKINMSKNSEYITY
jgi:hypothetical protein